jgi:hypothetical protein
MPAARPITVRSPIVVRSRTCAWSPTIASSPIWLPAYTTAPAQTVTRAPIRSGGNSVRAAVELRASRGDLPSTAPCSITQPSPTTVPS